MVSLLLVGTGMLLEAASTYVVLGYAAFKGYDTGAGGYLWGALATLLLLIAITVLYAGLSVRKGLFPRSSVLVLFLAAISLFMEGAETLVTPTGGLSVTVSALTLAAGVILIAALFFSASESTWMLLTVAVLGLVSVMLLLVRIADLSGAYAQVVGSSLNSYMFSEPVTQPAGVAGAANFFSTVGIVGTTSLAYIAYLIAAIGLAIWAILKSTKFAPLAWVTALVGFLLYGIDMGWGNASALATAEQRSIDWTTGALPFASSIILLVASCVVITSAAVGLLVHGEDLRVALTEAAEEPEAVVTTTQAAETKICPNCGTEISTDSVYCKKCGTKLASDWFSAGQGVTGKTCIKCGTENPIDHAYCKKCGSRLMSSEPAT